MAVYTVFEPPERRAPANRTAAEHADRFVFVRDGFYWSAFLLGPLWILYRRLWLVFVAYAVVVVAVHVGLRAAGVDAAGQAVVDVLIALLTGVEAATLRRFTLARRGWHELAAVIGDDLDSAERRFFDAWAPGRPAAPSAVATAAPAAVARTSSPHGVIGLFPEPGGGR